MTLVRATCQGKQTLAEFYVNLAAQGRDQFRAYVSPMIELIGRLEILLESLPVYGVTSHEVLCLRPVDDYRVPAPVTVGPSYDAAFQVTFLLPSAVAPWPNARVHGLASSAQHAANLIEIAIQRSEAWRSE